MIGCVKTEIDTVDAAILSAIAVTKSRSWPEWIDLTDNDKKVIILSVMSHPVKIDVAGMDWFIKVADQGNYRVNRKHYNTQLVKNIEQILDRL